MKYGVLILAFIGLLLAFSQNANACSCAFGGGAPCQEFWRVDAVFAGTLVSSGKINVDEGGYKHDMRLVRFTVEQPIRGMQTTEVEVLTGWGGGDCGYGFEMGKRYLVYAHRDQKGNRLATSICTRTRLVSEAGEDFSFIRALPTATQQGLIFGTLGKRNHHWKEGENWYKPIADAELTIEGQGVQYQARSDAEGKFRVENVLPGKYVVKLKLPPGLIRDHLSDKGGNSVENELEVVPRGCAETGFYLESDTRVSGRVLDANGNAVPKLALNMRGVAIDKGTVNTFLNAVTDADGYFEFTTVPPGQYLLGVRLLTSSQPDGPPYPRTYYPGVTSRALARVVTVTEGEFVKGLELRLTPPLSQRIVKGVVVGADGRPASRSSVYLSLIEEGEMTAFSSVPTDENGVFALKLYEGLQYKVSAFRPGPAGKYYQSEYIDIPLNMDQPLRLVLPAQPTQPR